MFTNHVDELLHNITLESGDQVLLEHRTSAGTFRVYCRNLHVPEINCHLIVCLFLGGDYYADRRNTQNFHRSVNEFQAWKAHVVH